jgi:hypothetical protein
MRQEAPKQEKRHVAGLQLHPGAQSLMGESKALLVRRKAVGLMIQTQVYRPQNHVCGFLFYEVFSQKENLKVPTETVALSGLRVGLDQKLLNGS